jgi:hypothetical protein
MSSNKLFPEVGNSAAENSTRKIFTAQQWDLFTYTLIKPQDEMLMPKDELRQWFSILFTKMALKFLLDHELAHIIFGHLDLANSKGLNSIAEKESTSFVGMDSQSIEMDADAFATHQAMIDLFVYNSDPELPERHKKFCCDFKNGISNWMFSIYSFYRIFAYQNNPAENLSQRTHPPIGLRLRMIFGSLSQTVRRLDPKILEEDLINMHIDTLIKVEGVMTEISEMVRGVEEIEFSFSEEGKNHMNDVVLNWRKLKVKLRPFAFSELAD